MNERVEEEIGLLKEKFPRLRHGDKHQWVLIPEFPLPVGRYNKGYTDLLFNIPLGYPNTGPDDFFVEGDLKLMEGGNPLGFNVGSKSSSGPAQVEANWGWFSWHPVSWRPAATIQGGDNLLTFLRGVNLCLKGAETS